MGARGWSPRERLSQRDVEAKMSDYDDDDTEYKVVQNHEEQFSLWPSYKEPPSGWKEVGKSGSKQECLDYIQKVWTDTRSASIREALSHRAPVPNDGDE